MMKAKQLRVALDFYPDEAEVLIKFSSGVLVFTEPATNYDEKNGYVYLEVCDQSKECACGGTLTVPDPHSEDGYAPCPECTEIYPHKIENNSCIYCGMYYADGACPSLNHPARKGGR